MPDRSEGVETRAVEYEPISVKELLIQTKDTSELLIDLAYSAVLHNSREIADEVLELEQAMDVIQMRSRMSLLLAARNPREAEQLAPVLGMVAGAEKISDAAGDIAKVVHEEIGLPDAVRLALPEAVETVARGTVSADSPHAGRSLEDIDLESETGVRVIAIRRDDDWIMNPGPADRLEPDDVAIIRGPIDALQEVYGSLTDSTYEIAVEDDTPPDYLDRAVDSIVLMKDLSELAVDLAYTSVLLDSAELAREVNHLEIEVDSLRSRFEAWVLQAAADVDDPVKLRGLLHLGFATEMISDAAIEISEGILRDIDVHPVTQEAVQESDELMIRIEVESDSDLAGTAVDGGIPEALPAINVLAIRRPGEGWMLLADGSTTLRVGDVVIGKGTASAVDEFRSASLA